MKDEPVVPTDHSIPAKSLDERFARRPQVLQRLHRIGDLMDESIAQGCSADEAEDMAAEEVSKLGADILADWAGEQALQSLHHARQQHPQAIQDGKKKLQWHTIFGTVSLTETVLRLGRRGRRIRPFSRDAGVGHRQCSRRLQRVLVDFGAESSFERAAKRVWEHYRIEVSRHALYTHTLQHGRAMGAFEPADKPRPADQLLTQVDGSMVPLVEPGKGADRRKGKTLGWGEVRLCSARVPGASQPLYGATRGSPQTVALCWEHTASAAGWSPRTQVHGIGDGAPWIADTFENLFGQQGSFLIDFYHVSEYLARASTVIKNTEVRARQWRRTQQGRLLNNRSSQVLKALQQESLGAGPEHPATQAHRYLKDRQKHLDYQGARQDGRPIGSGEIESGHRHVIQQRLKIAGAWWKESNLQPMLNLRVLRANELWNDYWQSLSN